MSNHSKGRRFTRKNGGKVKLLSNKSGVGVCFPSGFKTRSQLRMMEISGCDIEKAMNLSQGKGETDGA